MPLTKEQLLQPRYMVIAIDTSERFEVGELLNHPHTWHDHVWKTEAGAIIFNPQKYPHLFKPLPWWSDRKPEDMPGYVKTEKGLLCKVVDFEFINNCVNILLEGEKTYWPADFFEPATEEEYTAYINAKK